MPSPITAGLHCLFLLVTACCQTSQDSNFHPFIQYIIDSVLGEESFQSEMQRQKRNVCLPSDENKSCCSCENGYAWPSTLCSDLITCPSVSLAPNLPCSYVMEKHSLRPYCEPQTEDLCGMGEPIIMNMSVRLNKSFWDDLTNSSSESYKNYKDDLEKAFNASYRCLPGFVSATVTGFRPGSVFVNYEVKAGAASFDQIVNSNKIVPQFLDASYQLDQATFTTKITDQTNFTVSPVDIFEGDTVRLTCQINSTSQNVTWYYCDQIISTGFPYLIERNISTKTSWSTLEIINVTVKDNGTYGCSFTNSNRFHTLIYKATKPIAVSPLHITPNINDTDVVCNSPEMQTNSLLLSCCIDRRLPSLTGDWKVNGTINITGVSSFSENCTEYKLNINESVCPPDMSGTVTTYTCELRTGHGARHSQNISVTYLRAASVTISSNINSSVSEGYRFNLTCKSDVRNYDSISWKIQSENETKTVDCDTCIENSKIPAMSVLTVQAATQDWNGTYICTFFQKYLASSANVTIEVIPLPPKQNILIKPIAASIPCKVQQALECCISANTTENYDVTFVVQENKSEFGKNLKGDFNCYVHNYTEIECSKEKKLIAYCKFMNRIGQQVNSENITLHLIPGKEVSCSDSLGIGVEGATLIMPCMLNNSDYSGTRGNVTYKCSNKEWKLARNDCLSETISKLLTEAESLVKSPDAKARLPRYLEELKNKTESQQNIINTSPANLGAIVTILYTVSSIPARAEESIIENFLSTVDFIVADSTTGVWEDLNKEDILKSSRLLQSVDKFAQLLQPVNNNIPFVFANSLQLQGIAVTENNNFCYKKSFSSTENLTASVFIGENEIQTLPQNSTVVSVMYSTLGNILPQNGTNYVNSLLITTTVSSNRSQKFNINMTFAKKNSSLKMPQCVFWNFTLNEHRAGWDTYGCTPTEREDSVTCYCSHLTSFSILMSPDKSPQVIFEDYITYIGLAISILSLVACIIIESLVWKYVTNNTTSYMRHICILNIATSLLIADIWFIVTASINDQNQQMSKGVCFVATFFIHLFYLCVFFWMLSLGLILFYRLVFILHNTSKTAQKAVAFCLGYGCPFVIAVITIAVTLPRNSYTRNDVCWLNWKDSKALLAFVIPALIIVATNLFITAVVIIKILRPTIGDRSNKQERNSLFQIGKSVAILTPLLGLTWGFGLATIVKNSHRAFHILFCLLNALQGLFILVFGTLWDKKIQEALLKRNSMSKWSSQQTKSSSLILVTPMLAMSYPFSRTFNNLCGKTGKYRVSSSEPSSSSSENTSKSYSLLN
ncbi:adhesion G protein-coupled receptor F5 isoform X2 [Buteo buteo]|uniref:adhesion G protein-coupled receptor F5 isoform X2 n=1 Tax=Buteo buteo TaxID=30397 RepID=UPI003EBB2063